jgi:3-oxoacyl-[acyl-carrier protein] reductase
MLLQNKTAIIYGAAGSVGTAVAKAFAAQGARLFIAGRTLSTLNNLANEIRTAGGMAETAKLNALDEQEVNRHADEVVDKTGQIDISFNLIGVESVNGIALKDISVSNYMQPVTIALQTQFITSTAASRYMIEQNSGVILMLTANVAIHAGALVGGWGVTCAAVEGFSRSLAGELGPHGVRVVCLRSAGSPDSKGVDEVFNIQAETAGISRMQFQARMEDTTLLKRLPALKDIADIAVFMASDKARAITAAITNITCGAVID